ncbi:hypothetical protein AHP1_371 [Aeromonas phage Ahp1_CNU-2021]|nr:hypothetical protein AHP1_371 [Aeromonas phage Ahp1_CNU-2021]
MYYNKSDVNHYPSEFVPLGKNRMYKLSLAHIESGFFTLSDVFNDDQSGCREYHFKHFSRGWQFVVLTVYPNTTSIRAKIYNATSATIAYESIDVPKNPVPGQFYVSNGILGFDSRERIDVEGVRPIQVGDTVIRNKSASTKKQTKEWTVWAISHNGNELALSRGDKQVVIHATNSQEMQAYGLIWSE